MWEKGVANGKGVVACEGNKEGRSEERKGKGRWRVNGEAFLS
jgi:hypothetical protein